MGFLPPFVCVSVWLLVIPHDVSITDAAGITKLDIIEMFHDESRKLCVLGVLGAICTKKFDYMIFFTL